jgi:hypothetical protein
MENVEQAQTPGPAVEGAPQTEQTQPELNIVDLQNLRAIVDTACRRGAFGGAELTAVGTTFDRLNTFLNAVAPAQQPADQPAE